MRILAESYVFGRITQPATDLDSFEQPRGCPINGCVYIYICQRELNTRTLVMYMLNCISGRRTGSSPCARKRVRAALAMPHQCPAILA